MLHKLSRVTIKENDVIVSKIICIHHHDIKVKDIKCLHYVTTPGR